MTTSRGCVDAGVLSDPRALRDWITRYGEYHGSVRFPVASALAFKAYTWALIEAAVGRWVTERRVVDVSMSRVRIRTEAADEPQLEFVALHHTVLPDDPMAGQPGVAVVATEDELLEVLRRTLVDNHLEPAVEAFRALRGGGPRPLWGTVAQSIGYPAATADPTFLPDRAATVQRLLSILPDGVAQLVEIAELDEGQGWRPLLLRRTCCYAYTLPAYGQPCLTCCLLDDAGRDAVAAEDQVSWRRCTSCG
ncbi:IucA/IucC family C-terminal-domain containing protein [Cryptosporangium arvum]|uniref:Putative Fe-S protein n=1 Tax=Cryptosporangium arvum DSM 44712 TaxID=927661 RepID=A0A010ZP90_9ACTN|nr:IucA/IucC family C-terminal-domain containing protein [Cryptosporangium arvum]EXG79047.1 putative Fe-S protein [Cryptosporangium arvum DSM 44712]